MSAPRLVEIVGGGLAGLSLGLALRRAGAPVRLFEAGDYPRHRVCGEFITGLAEATRVRLGLEPLLADAQQHRDVKWYLRSAPLSRQRLPSPALALSRHALDARLAETFVAAGGELITHARLDPRDAPNGRVFAHGRGRTPSSWLGLKAHVRGLNLASALEVHLGENAYVGICSIENGAVNVCGLFRQRSIAVASREKILGAYLRAAKLDSVADRLANAELQVDSCSAVAGLGFARRSTAHSRVHLGDAFAMIPPFTGNGMAMAFQSAESALDPLLAWSRGEMDWITTVLRINRDLRIRFQRRLTFAGVLHPFVLRPTRQRWFAAAARTRLLPLRSLYHAVH